MEKNYRANPDKQDGILDWSTMRGTSVPKRIDEWAANPPVGMAMERLTEIFRMGTNNKMLFIKFEDLTKDPQTELNKVYDFFEVERYTHDFSNIQQITQEDDFDEMGNRIR
jgi:sulfotransferase